MNLSKLGVMLLASSSWLATGGALGCSGNTGSAEKPAETQRRQQGMAGSAALHLPGETGNDDNAAGSSNGEAVAGASSRGSAGGAAGAFAADSVAGSAGAFVAGSAGTTLSGGATAAGGTAAGGSAGAASGGDIGLAGGSGGAVGPAPAAGGGSAAGSGAGGSPASPGSGGVQGAAPPTTECNDGIDNDGDGLVDWQYDLGCYAAADRTERSLPQAEEDGWTTFDLSPDSRVIYVSSSQGNDENDGLSPRTAVATPARGAELVRDGSPDFLLFRRGDSWRGQDIGADRGARRFKSGLDEEHPLVLSSYGDSTRRPVLEIDKPFIDDDGHERSHLAVVGLAFIAFPKVPGDPSFNGADGEALRFVGTGHDILVEDNFIEYGGMAVQNVSDVAIRRNVVRRSYHVDTCAYRSDGTLNPNGNSTYRPSGIFAGKVRGLLIEGNVWDENGWNPDVESACATIYNHNIYLSNVSELVVRENLILRASSIGIKLTSNGAGATNDVLIENNLIAEGELGISMGGNEDTEHRFSDATIRGNVFTDVGRSQPTARGLAWYVELSDNDGTLFEENLLVNQPPLGNVKGLALAGGTNRDVVVRDNLFYGFSRRLLLVEATSQWAGNRVERNAFVATESESCLVGYGGPIDGFEFTGNAYQAPVAANDWFCVGDSRLDLPGWVAATGEVDASTWSGPPPPDAGRNLDSYAATLGLGATLDDFAAAARLQSRHGYRPELSAAAANDYIREGFGVPRR